MANVFEYNGYKPVISKDSFIHPNAHIIGDVFIEENVYIGPGASLRGDMGRIHVKKGSNIQDNCTVHMFPGVTVVLEENSHIGHGAIVHGAHIGKNVLVGMNAVVMDNVEVGEGSIIGALAFVPADMEIPKRKVVVGNPAKIVKDVSDKMLEWKTEGTELYQKLAKVSLETLHPSEALNNFEIERPVMDWDLKTWDQTKK